MLLSFLDRYIHMRQVQSQSLPVTFDNTVYSHSCVFVDCNLQFIFIVFFIVLNACPLCYSVFLAAFVHYYCVL